MPNELEPRLRELEEYRREVEVRLQNGVHSFADLKGEIMARFGELKIEIGALRPKPPSLFQLFTGMFGVVVVVLGAWWTFSEKFAERPTAPVVAKMVSEAPANVNTSADIKSLRDEIAGIKLQENDNSTTLKLLQKQRR